MTIYRLTLRQLLSGRRGLVLVGLAAIAPALSAIYGSATDDLGFLQDGMPNLVLGVLVPLMALILAGSAIAADIEEGTAVYIFTKPVPRARILLERYAGTASATVGLGLTSAVLALAIQQGRVDAFATVLVANCVAVVVGGVVYSGIFIALSLLTRRGIIVGLIYVLIWESALAGSFAGTRTLSVKEYMRAIVSTLDTSGFTTQGTALTLTTSLAMAAVLLVLSLAFALRRISNFEVSEQS